MQYASAGGSAMSDLVQDPSTTAGMHAVSRVDCCLKKVDIYMKSQTYHAKFHTISMCLNNWGMGRLKYCVTKHSLCRRPRLLNERLLTYLLEDCTGRFSAARPGRCCARPSPDRLPQLKGGRPVQISITYYLLTYVIQHLFIIFHVNSNTGICVSQSRNPGIGKGVRDCQPYAGHIKL